MNLCIYTEGQLNIIFTEDHAQEALTAAKDNTLVDLFNLNSMKWDNILKPGS